MKKSIKKPTFLIQMLNYQNMTWQGIVTCLDTNQKTPFRSLLELLKLMDSVIVTADFDPDIEPGSDSDSDTEAQVFN